MISHKQFKMKNNLALRGHNSPGCSQNMYNNNCTSIYVQYNWVKQALFEGFHSIALIWLKGSQYTWCVGTQYNSCSCD